MEVSERYTPPRLKGWYGVIDRNTLANKQPHELPKRLLFEVEEHMQLVFTDIIALPCLMVSEMVRDMILLYEPGIEFVRIVVLSKEKKKSEAYYIPFLPKADCLWKSSVLNLDRSVIKQAVVEQSKLSGHAIVQVDKVNCQCILVSLELAESILRRTAMGIMFREVQIV